MEKNPLAFIWEDHNCRIHRIELGFSVTSHCSWCGSIESRYELWQQKTMCIRGVVPQVLRHTEACLSHCNVAGLFIPHLYKLEFCLRRSPRISLQANQTDIYVSGPLLAAYKECIVGPPELLNPPSWLNYSFGPVVSIDSGGGANRVPSSGASIDNSSTASTGTTGQQTACPEFCLWSHHSCFAH